MTDLTIHHDQLDAMLPFEFGGQETITIPDEYGDILNMTDLSTQVQNLAVQTGTDVAALYALANTLKVNQGNLTSLSTTAKGSLVEALNELQAALVAASEIDDSLSAAGSTWSSSKIMTELAALGQSVKNDLFGDPSISAQFDTFIELANEIQSNQGAVASINTALANRVRFDAPQSLTPSQQQQARSNIDAASPAEVAAVDAKVGNTAAIDPVGAYNTTVAPVRPN